MNLQLFVVWMLQRGLGAISRAGVALWLWAK
jgi:hypothetical protein